MSDVAAILLGSYCAGFVVAAIGLRIAFYTPNDLPWIPREGQFAAGCIGSLLWPLVVACLVGWLLALAPRRFVRSFAALWRAWRPRAVELPKATARERLP